MDKIEKQKNFFNSISDEYFEARKNRNHLCYKDRMYECVLKRTKRYLLNKKKSRIDVLEMMCGYGEGYDIIKEHILSKVSYTGFDYSENLIKKVKEQRPELDVFVQDVTSYIPGKLYDIVLIIGGLHHVPTKVDKVLESVFYSLSEGGIFISFEPTHNNIVYEKIRNYIYRKNHIFDEETEHDFGLNELNNKYSRTGFTLVEQYHVGLLAYILYYNPDAFPFLNRGSEEVVKKLQKVDELFYKSWLGKKFSFATFSVLQKKRKCNNHGNSGSV